MFYFIVILLAVIGVMYSNNKNLKEDNERLRKLVNKLRQLNTNLTKKLEKYENNSKDIVLDNTIPKSDFKETVIDISNPQVPNTSTINVAQNMDDEIVSNFHEENNTNTQSNNYDNSFNMESPKDKETSRNTMILVSGAILIVLAAIVFLLSNWNTIPDILKTGTLTLLIGVFFGASRLADKKFNLEKTSKTFYFIAMAYIPIVLLSISIFQLFGEYLSITGSGKYLYFTISSIFLALLYFKESIRIDNRVLNFASIIMQIISVIFIVLCFSNNYFNIILGVIIYNLLLSGFLKVNKLPKFDEEYRTFCKLDFLALNGLLIASSFFSFVANSCSLVHIIGFSLLIINTIILDMMKKDYRYLVNTNIIAIIISVLCFKGIGISLGIKLLIISISLMVVHVLNYALFKTIVDKLISYFVMNLVGLSILNVSGNLEYSKYIPVITTLIIMVLEFNNSKEYIRNYILSSFIISFVLLNINISVMSFIALVLLSVAYIFYTKKNNLSETYELVPMVSLIPSIFFSDVLVTGFNMALIFGVILILITTFVSVLKKQINMYTLASALYITLCIVKFDINFYISVFAIIIWAVIHVIMHNPNDLYKILAYVTGTVLYNKIIADIGFTQITLVNMLGYIACVFLISRTVVKLREGPCDIVEALGMLCVYIYSIIVSKGTGDITILLIFMLLAAVTSFRQKGDWLYVISVAASAIMINRLLLNMNFTTSTLLLLIGYIIALHMISRTVIKEAEGPFKELEYVALSIIYIVALFSYTSIADAMIFVAFLMALVIFGYIKRYGPMFFVSLVAVVVNGFKLTKDFWYSIPWWVYLLMVGAGLLTFAIVNEKSEKDKLKEMFERLKDRVDM